MWCERFRIPSPAIDSVSAVPLIHGCCFSMTVDEEQALVCGMLPEYINLATTLNHIDMVITLVVPFIIIVVLNTLISRTVWRVARVRRSMTKSGHHSLPGGKASTSTSTRRTSSSQTKVTEMLLVVSTVFICLNLPSYLVRLYIFIRKVRKSLNN